MARPATRRGHRHDLRIFDRLPPVLRARLRRARGELCSGCIANMLRADGLEATLAYLEYERRFKAVQTRAGQNLFAEEELRP